MVLNVFLLGMVSVSGRNFQPCMAAMTLFAAASEATRLRAGTNTAKEPCSFLAHAPGSPHDETWITAGPSNILFQHSNVFVVAAEDRMRRYLVFRQDDGSCNEQAEQICGPPPTSMASTPAEASPKCAACDLGLAEPPLSYLRSMIAGAVQFLGDSGDRLPAMRMLSIGLGSGALPAWLLRNTDSQVDVAEIAAGVVEAAPCFGLNNSPNFHLTHDDGRQFLEQQSEGSYDAIFIDAFDSNDTIPCGLSTADFFAMVRSKLKESSGILSLNVVDNPPLEEVLASVQTAFHNVMLGTAPGLTNRIILASASNNAMLQAGVENDKGPVARWFGEAMFHGIDGAADTTSQGRTVRHDSNCV